MQGKSRSADIGRPTVVFSEQFYFPDGWAGAQLPRDITIHLAICGYQVEVICGTDQYAPTSGETTVDPRSHGVRIHRIPRLLRGRIHRAKLLRQLWFCAAAAPLLLLRRRPELLVTQTNPPFIVPLVAAVAAWHRRPFVIIAQDLYPEVLLAHGMIREGSIAYRALLKMFGWAYRRASRVVALGSTMAKRIGEKGVSPERIEMISNWATGDESIVRGRSNLLRGEWGLNECFVILYSGNLGVAHDVETPILALKEIIAEVPNARLIFVGSGSRLADADRMARKTGVTHAVQFRPLVPLDLLPHSLGLANLALVTLRAGFDGLVVPSKLLGYMARGIATIYVGPQSDVQELIESANGGVCAENGDVAGLAAHLRWLIRNPDLLARMGEAARNFYRERLARSIGLERYRTVVEGVLRSERRGH